MSNDKGGEIRKSWTVTVSIEERDRRTRAKARLHWRDQVLVGVGFARRSPTDRPVNEIGDELAVARALSDLAGRLMDLTAHDIQVVTNQPVTDLH